MLLARPFLVTHRRGYRQVSVAGGLHLARKADKQASCFDGNLQRERREKRFITNQQETNAPHSPDTILIELIHHLDLLLLCQLCVLSIEQSRQ